MSIPHKTILTGLASFVSNSMLSCIGAGDVLLTYSNLDLPYNSRKECMDFLFVFL